MFFWGGLRPIAHHVIVDVLALVGFGYGASTQPDSLNAAVLVSTYLFSVAFSGNMTNRWTILFPMAPFVVLQGLRRLLSNKWIRRTIAVLSVLLILIAAALSVLFPAVELPPLLTKQFNVGVADVFLPVNFEHMGTANSKNESCANPNSQDHVTVRILYPTLEAPESFPYLRKDTAAIFCEESMKTGAPPPLKAFSWMLHYWRLAKIPVKANAKPLDKVSPIIAYSHGLGGNAELYTYQTMALAASGYVVLVLTHADGTAPVVRRKDGIMKRNNDVVKVRY
jgi:hypothetical protein